jgi:hypothetical protein
MTELKREITFNPAWDERNPDPGKDYGIHGVDMRFILIGDKGAVQFVLYTNWHLPHVMEEFEAKRDLRYNFFAPMPADIGYHSLKPMYDSQDVMKENCEYLGGQPCYYDGSGLWAVEYFETLVTEGGEALWEKLERYYYELFESEVEP